MRPLLPALFALAATVCPGQTAPPALFGEIDAMVSELSAITGLKPKNKVAHDMINRVRLKLFLEERISEAVKPEEIRAEETTLKKFGFVPPEFDLRGSTIELLTEQAAAFYDFKRKKLFVLDSSSSQLQQTALVHELAHALADQHFNLEKFMDRGVKSDDESTARLAVMEGQASWLMAEYAARHAGQSLATNRAMLDLMANEEMSGAQFPVFEKAPLYIRETLLFPYTAGVLFQHEVFEKLGKEGFAEVFRRPPTSTQQILHPQLYLTRKEPAVVMLPEAPEVTGWRELASGTVGELDHGILLRQYVGKDEAAALTPQWTGGRYRLMEQKKGGPAILQYASEWGTAEAARRFFGNYRAVLKGKWKRMEVETDEPGLLAGRGDDGEFRVTLSGTRVTSVEGVGARAHGVEATGGLSAQ